MKNNYPTITNTLINKLKEDFPDKLPETEISSYRLGYLIGQQSIIRKLEFERKEQEERD